MWAFVVVVVVRGLGFCPLLPPYPITFWDSRFQSKLEVKV